MLGQGVAILECFCIRVWNPCILMLGYFADGAGEPANAAKRSNTAKAAYSNHDEVGAYDTECWAFSSRYIKTTQAALQLAVTAIQVCH